ncbi:MAG: hypothetical protein ACK2UK_14295 [Candidatus Promineifilaceae bacterium]
MPIAFQMATFLISEETPQAALNPFWVPVVLFILVLLIFVWGMTRGTMRDETLPPVEADELISDAHVEEPSH